MKYPILFFGFVLAIVVSISMIFTNYSNPVDQLNKMMAEQPLDDCYDNTMDTWFIEFNTNQEEGVTMQEADKKAAAKALGEFDECQSAN